MKNIKAIIVLIILLLGGALAVVGLRTAKTYLSGAAAGTEPKGVRVQAEAQSAVITWQTDKEAQGIVEYGTTPASLLLRALETQPTKVHRVTLSPLRADTTYYFRIRVGETIYDNNGIPYSFKTQGEGGGKNNQLPVISPTVAVSPAPTVTGAASITGSQTNPAKVAQCIKAEFMEKFGTNDARYDFDNNGTVNTRDWVKCLQLNQTEKK